MKRNLTAALLLVAASLAASLPVEAQTPQEQARHEMGEGARLYAEGDFAGAQRHFERAHALDPEHKTALISIAQAISRQFNPRSRAPENLAKGEEAVAAYKRAIEQNPESDPRAFLTVALLLRQMGAAAAEREWLTQHAENGSAPVGQRRHAYTVLASWDVTCTHDITERPENRRVVGRGRSSPVVYVRPQSEADFQMARACATRGLEFAERAVALAPDDPDAWAYKAALLGEMAKLAQMENDDAGKADYEQRAAEADAERKRISEAAAKAEHESGEEDPPAAGRP